MKTEDDTQQPQNLIQKKKQLQQLLSDIENRIDTLETNYLSRWECGNMLLSWDFSLNQSKKKCRIVIPPEAKRFSIASSSSPAFSELSYLNQPLRSSQRQKFYRNRKLRSKEQESQILQKSEKSTQSLQH